MKKRKASTPKADVHIDRSTFNGPPHGVKLDQPTADAVKALADAVTANAKALSDIAALIKGGDSYGLYLAGTR